MKICSMTMAGPGTGEALTEALTTVSTFVDHNIIHNPGEITDFSGQRNSLLATAAATGYDWGIMLDTDERIIETYDGEFHRLREDLMSLHADAYPDVWMAPHVSGFYAKERIFRLPARGHYHGRTHEAFILDDGARRETLSGLAFDETPKTPEQYQAKLRRDMDLLCQQVEEEPEDPRWRYYLGDTYAGMGEKLWALNAFQRCWSLKGWDEESAWAAYRSAEILSGLERYDAGVEWCSKGMRRHPGMAELPWLAGWCSYRMGAYQHALWWEEMAVALNTAGAHHDRISFRHLPALYEGPYDVMRYAYRELGDEVGAAVAERQFTVALTARENSRT